MKRIQSFTLLELMISLLISSIVISIAYYVYFLFSAQFVKQQKNTGAINEFQLFRSVFQNDLGNALTVNDSLDKTVIICFSEKISVRYFFSKDFFVRNANDKTDTFNFRASVTNFNYLNDTIPLITALEIGARIEKEEINSFFSKRYSANQIMQATIHE